MLTVKIETTEELDLDFYLKALVDLAVGDDGRIDEHEKAFIQAQAGIYGVDAKTYLKGNGDWRDVETSGVVPSRETALSIVRDGVALGYINGHFSAEQRQILYEVALKVGLEKKDVDAVESWLKEYWAVIEKGNRLLRNE